MIKSLISVIMATYNNDQFLKKALASVLDQTYKNIEFIVINDASTDNTLNILKKFISTDKRIVILNNGKRLGQTNSLNLGITQAKGEFIARIDSDDIWCSVKKLEKQMEFLNKHLDYGMVGCWSKTINAKGKITSSLEYPVRDSDIRKYFLIENCFTHSSILIRTSLLQKKTAYNPSYEFAQDYDLWLSVALRTKIYNLPFFMVHYRKNPNGMSQQYYKKQISETIRIIKNYSNKYPHSKISLFLWKMRLYIPHSVREAVSSLLRKLLFDRSYTS